MCATCMVKCVLHACFKCVLHAFICARDPVWPDPTCYEPPSVPSSRWRRGGTAEACKAAAACHYRVRPFHANKKRNYNPAYNFNWPDWGHWKSMMLLSLASVWPLQLFTTQSDALPGSQWEHKQGGVKYLCYGQPHFGTWEEIVKD